MDDKQVAFAFRKLAVGALERLLEKVGVITPEEFITERTIGCLHLYIDVAAITFDRVFQALRALAPWARRKFKPPSASQVPSPEALADCREEVIVVCAGKPSTEFNPIRPFKQADRERSREVGLPGRLVRAKLSVHWVRIEAPGVKNPQAGLQPLARRAYLP